MWRLYDWVMTRLHCCGCGCGFGIAFIGVVGAGGGWLTWQLI